MSRKTRKLIWSVPLVAVLAVAGALAMFVSLAPGGAPAAHLDILDAPTNGDWPISDATAESRTDHRWQCREKTAPPGAGGRLSHRRLHRQRVTWMDLEAEHRQTPTLRTFTRDWIPIRHGSIYRVFALNSAGTGLVSNTSQGRIPSGTAMPDDGDAGLTADLVRASNGWHKIDLSWTAPDTAVATTSPSTVSRVATQYRRVPWIG